MGQLILVFAGITLLIALYEKLISPLTERLNLGEVASIALATIVVVGGIVVYGFFNKAEAQPGPPAAAASTNTQK